MDEVRMEGRKKGIKEGEKEGREKAHTTALLQEIQTDKTHSIPLLNF